MNLRSIQALFGVEAASSRRDEFLLVDCRGTSRSCPRLDVAPDGAYILIVDDWTIKMAPLAGLGLSHLGNDWITEMRPSGAELCQSGWTALSRFCQSLPEVSDYFNKKALSSSSILLAFLGGASLNRVLQVN